MTTPQETQPTGVRSSDQIARSLVLAVLYAVPALLCVFAGSVSDPDLWWHLRSGEWILQHHAIPHTDPFSSTVAGHPWAAYSWLFEFAIFQLFQRLGLMGIVIYTSGMVLAITLALQHLIKRLQTDFTVGVLLTFLATLSLWRLDAPRPWHFTILFFILELDILMHARRTGRTRELLWLPVLFALWANLHIQFIDGLLLLALATAEAAAASWWPAARTRLKAVFIVPVFAACILATLCNPYGSHIYGVAHDLAAQSGVVDHLAELQAIPFRNVSDYCVLLLTLAAAAALARSGKLPVFETAAFAAAVFLSFRSQRDVWIMAAVASAILAACIPSRSVESRTAESCTAVTRTAVLRWPGAFAHMTPRLAIVAFLSLLLYAGFRVLHVDNTRLQANLESDLPVHAAAFIRERNLPGPLFNDYPWGGYLIWSLRPLVSLPDSSPDSLHVSIDGRAALYGTERLDRAAATWNAAPDWNTDPNLQRSRLVLGPVHAPLTQLLRSDPRFQLVYEDTLATVFIRR